MRDIRFTIAAVAIVALLACNVWLILEVGSLRDKLVEATTVALKERSLNNDLKEYVRRNIALHEATDPNELYERFAAAHNIGRDTVKRYVAMFPSSGCGSCLSNMCFALEDMGVTKERVHVVLDRVNRHLTDQLKARDYKNIYVDSSLFIGLPNYGEITFIENNARGARLMLFDVSHSEFLKTFVKREN